MAPWTQEDVDRVNARRGAKLPAHTRPSEQAKSKYRNVRTMIGSEVFDSKKEADYWLILKAREALNEIEGLRRQVPFSLYCPDIFAPHENREVSSYVADFVYSDGRMHVVDAKGMRTRMYLLKKKWLELQCGIVIEEV